jgi:hypothetical protein
MEGLEVGYYECDGIDDQLIERERKVLDDLGRWSVSLCVGSEVEGEEGVEEVEEGMVVEVKGLNERDGGDRK